MMQSPCLPYEDLDHVMRYAGRPLRALDGKRLFITGGTGFFGAWLLESFQCAVEHLHLNAHATVLTRDPAAFARKAPHLADSPHISFVTGDVRSFSLDLKCDLIIHAATASTGNLNRDHPLEMIDTIVHGTRRMLDLAVATRAEGVLLVSSGAVYGPQPADVTHVREDQLTGPAIADPASSYGEAKRLSELMGAIYSAREGLNVKIARGFAFVGPHLPLDAHFAIGNFIRDRLRGERIVLNGDGAPFRSYLYASDLAVWLWTILMEGASGAAYNVGSEDGRPLADVANVVARGADPALEVRVSRTAEPGATPSRYVPSTERARRDLNLEQRVPLEEAVEKTVRWHTQDLEGGG